MWATEVSYTRGLKFTDDNHCLPLVHNYSFATEQQYKTFFENYDMLLFSFYGPPNIVTA